jgi:hypothetical protein
MLRFISILYGTAAVFLALLTVVFFGKLGPRDLTPWVSLLAGVSFASTRIKRLKKFSERINQLFTVVLVSWTCFLMFAVWRGRGTGQSDGLFPLILFAFICMLVGTLMIRLGLRLRRRR